MAHPISWPSYLSNEHLIRDPYFERERDRDLRRRINLAPPSWSSSDRLFHPPSGLHCSSFTQPFEPTTSLIRPNRKDRQETTTTYPTPMPKLTFKAALESLESSNLKAHTFFHKFYASFNEDIGPNLRIVSCFGKCFAIRLKTTQPTTNPETLSRTYSSLP